MNYDQFTLKAQDAIQEANSIAQQEDHSEIGTEHLLLALLEQEDGVIPPLVERIGLKVSTLIQQVEDLLATYPRITGNAQISFSPEAQKIIAKAGEYGISSRDIAVDPLALTISTGSENAKVACEVISAMSERGINTVMGVSNISFGLPGRELINSVFYTLALQAGLTSAIINPQSQMMMDAYYSFLALSGLDDGCKEYVARYANAPKAGATVVSEMSLFDAIVKGLIGESKKATAVALEKEAPLEVINKYMIPALDFVGEGFEKKTLFLPQLLMSADAAKAAFDVIRDSVGGSGEANGEKVIIATVQGDIHDIGKNIVKVLMENYGYRVIDLGKDVPVETVVAAAKEHGAKVVGLSALMTTTVAAMEETIKALRKEVDCKVVVGGAVLTPDYAEDIHADYYGKDAMAAKRIRYFDRYLLGQIKTGAQKYFATRAAVEDWRYTVLSVNGAPDEKAWEKAPVRYMVPWKPDTSEVHTSFKVLRDAKNLYFRVICGENDFKTMITERSGRDNPDLWQDSVVEFFLNPSCDRKNYYQIIVNSEGCIYDHKLVSWGGRKVSQPDWNSDAKVQITKGEKSYITVILQYPVLVVIYRKPAYMQNSVLHGKSCVYCCTPVP